MWYSGVASRLNSEQKVISSPSFTCSKSGASSTPQSTHGVENQIFTLCLKFDMEPDNDFPRICLLEAIIFSSCMFNWWNFANLLQLPLPQATAIPTASLLQTNLKHPLPSHFSPSHTQASYNDSLNLLRSLQWWLRCVASTSPSVLLPLASHCH